MKKAVIATGGKQYVVTEGQTLEIELLKDAADKKTVSFDALLVIDDKATTVGAPIVKDATVKAKIIDEIRGDKVTAIRYKAKKRVHKVRGHRQKLLSIQIEKIS